MSDAFTQEERESDASGFFEDPHFEEKLLSCWGLGPLDVCVTKISTDRVEVDIKLAGVRIGHGTLSAANSRLCASGSAVIVKVKVCVRADFGAKTVWVEGELCNRKILGGWNCGTFKTKILSW